MKKNPLILVVEDDFSWQLNYKEILESEGYLVEVAASKDEAGRKLNKRTFEIAIIDLRLVDNDPTNRDGIEVVKLVRDLKAPTLIIVSSVHLTEEIRDQIDKLGIFAFWDKSGSVQELRDLVAKAANSS